MSFAAHIITLYPELFPGHLGHSLAGRALARGDWSLNAVQLRDFADDKHKSVDDTPAGGGAGMVLRADILAQAIDATPMSGPKLLMSPRGKPFNQAMARDLAQQKDCLIVCGRFEGVDQRVIDSRDLMEVSLGDYILSGGEPAALAMLDAVVRLLPGVMGNANSGTEESFETGLLEHPHYTRPAQFEGMPIPDVLQSGHHENIRKWREARAMELTKQRRPDLLK
ncbi:MAG: tRNA (guanosine(37)-N1)-methyltransferase TrmD [Pseudomonadota bacterium]